MTMPRRNLLVALGSSLGAFFTGASRAAVQRNLETLSQLGLILAAIPFTGVLYGVTMADDGGSQILSVKLEEVGKLKGRE
jgi:hypothetical protein